MSQDLDPERKQELTNVALKVAAVVLGIGVIVGAGSFLMVKSLGLDEGSKDATARTRTEPVSPLPTTALPVPSESPRGDPNEQETVSPEPSPSEQDGKLQLHASPQSVSPMERINLTGAWPGEDNLTLVVQRQSGGGWEEFAGVTATVRAGSFETWVATGRDGEQVFRVYDPRTDTASNPVTVTVGG